MLQIIVSLLLYLVMVIPAGAYLYHIMAGKHTAADGLEAVRSRPNPHKRRYDGSRLSGAAAPEPAHL